jgi:hypothetical protein
MSRIALSRRPPDAGRRRPPPPRFQPRPPPPSNPLRVQPGKARRPLPSVLRRRRRSPAGAGGPARRSRRLFHARPRHGPARRSLERDADRDRCEPCCRCWRPSRCRRPPPPWPVACWPPAPRGLRGPAATRFLAGARASALIALGDVGAATRILDRAPGLDRNAALSQAAAETALLAGDNARACGIAQGLSIGRGEAYWLRLRAFCQARPARPPRRSSPSTWPRPRRATRSTAG